MAVPKSLIGENFGIIWVTLGEGGDKFENW